MSLRYTGKEYCVVEFFVHSVLEVHHVHSVHVVCAHMCVECAWHMCGVDMMAGADSR